MRLGRARHAPSGHSERVADDDHERCGVCGFDGSAYGDASLLAAIGELGARWRALLAQAGSDIAVRPQPKTWSALEYAAHSRDVTALHVFGVEQALNDDEPAYPAIDGAELIDTAAAPYSNEDPDAVVEHLDRQALRLRDRAAAAGADVWWRGITIGDHHSTVRRLLEHALHDSVHHLDDVERGLRQLRS
jgi:hypothetical protein